MPGKGTGSTVLVGDKPYFPSRGINYDSNGIIVRPEEAIDCVNLDISGSEVRPRFGTINLDPFIEGITSPLEDVIHYHRYLEPGGTTKLFGFTNKDIYVYTTGVGWSSVINSALIGGQRYDQWSTTDFIDLNYGATVVACGSIYTEPDEAESQGENRILVFYNRSTGQFERLTININFPITDEDVGITAPYAVPGQVYVDSILFKLKDYDKWADGADANHYEFEISLTHVPSGSTAPVVAVTLYEDAAKTTSTSDIADAIAATLDVSGDFTKFDKQAVVDAVNVHTTASEIVEASNGNDQAPSNTSALEVNKGVSGIVSGTLDYNESITTGFVKITPNQFYVKTEYGTIAACGSQVYSIGGKDAYRLLPVDTTRVAYGDQSYVYLDGSGFQVAFTTDEYGGLELYVDYYYEKEGGYKPKVVQVFRNALVFGNMYEDLVYYPWRLRYTEPGDMTITNDDWFIDLVITNTSGIRAIRNMETESSSTLGSYLYVYKDESVERGTYNATTFLDFDTALTEGMYAPRTLQVVEGVQIFLGVNDIYAFDGVRKVSLTYDPEMQSTRIKEFLLATLDPIVLKNTFAVYDKFRRKYILFIKNRQEIFPTNALVYDIDRKFWTRYKMPSTSAAIHLSLNLSFNTIDSLIGTIDNLAGTIDELGGYTTNQVSIYAMTKKSYVAVDSALNDKMSSVEDTQITKTHTLITRDFLFRNLEEAERISLMKFEAYGEAVTVGYSTEYDTLVNKFIYIPDHQLFSLSNKFKTYFYNLDTQADKVRFIFTSTKDFKLRWMQVFSIQTTEITEE